MNHSDECVRVENPHTVASQANLDWKYWKLRAGLTFAQGVWTVLRGVGRLAAALRAAAAAGGHRGPSHLDGFVSNDRRELFTLQRTERDRQASGVQDLGLCVSVTAAISATAAAAVSITISIIISYGRISMVRTLISTLWRQQCLTRFSFSVLNEHKFVRGNDIMLIKHYYSTRMNS